MRVFFSFRRSVQFSKIFEFLQKYEMDQNEKFFWQKKCAGSTARQNIFWRAVHIHMAEYGRYGQNCAKSTIIEYVRGGSIIILGSKIRFSIRVLQSIRISRHATYIGIYHPHHRYFRSAISGILTIISEFCPNF